MLVSFGKSVLSSKSHKPTQKRLVNKMEHRASPITRGRSRGTEKHSHCGGPGSPAEVCHACCLPLPACRPGRNQGA